MNIKKFQIIGATVLLATTLQANAMVTAHHQPVLSINEQVQYPADIPVLHFKVQNNGVLTLEDKVQIQTDTGNNSLKMDIAYGDLHNQKTTITINQDGTMTQTGKPANMVAQGNYNVVVDSDWQNNYNPDTRTYQAENTKSLLTKAELNTQVTASNQQTEENRTQLLKMVGLLTLGAGVSAMGIFALALKGNKEKKPVSGMNI